MTNAVLAARSTSHPGARGRLIPSIVLLTVWITLPLSLTCLAHSTAAASAQASAGTLERRVKAAYLYKFAGYVEWPPASLPQADSPIRIAVLGDDRLLTDLASLVRRRTVENHPVEAIDATGADSLDGVHILFVGKPSAGRLEALIDEARERSILVVTDFPGGLEQGGIINFVLDKRRVRFDISLDSALKGGLLLSSRLLSVARNVTAARS